MANVLSVKFADYCLQFKSMKTLHLLFYFLVISVVHFTKGIFNSFALIISHGPLLPSKVKFIKSWNYFLVLDIWFCSNRRKDENLWRVHDSNLWPPDNQTSALVSKWWLTSTCDDINNKALDKLWQGRDMYV